MLTANLPPPSPPRRRHQRLQVCASVPKTALSTYRLGRQPSSADWFQAAVRDIVKRVDRTPFLQLVQLGSGATLPRFLTVPVADSVVPVPEVSRWGTRGRVVVGFRCLAGHEWVQGRCSLAAACCHEMGSSSASPGAPSPLLHAQH